MKMSEARYAEAVALYTTGVSLRGCVERLGLPIRSQNLRGYMLTRGHPLRERMAAVRGCLTRRRRYRNTQGYVVLRIAGLKYLEHRLIAEDRLGRALLRDEHVHHLNGQKHDNRPANLAVVSPAEHGREHARERWANREWRERVVASWANGGNAGMFKVGHVSQRWAP